MWKAMMRKPLTHFLALILVVAACSRPAMKDEAVGAYAMNKGKAHDTLIVYSSGAYVRGYAGLTYVSSIRNTTA